MKNLARTFSTLALCAVFAISCSKKDQLSGAGLEKEPSIQSESVTALAVTCASDSIIGNCAAPSGGSWGAIDFDLSLPGRGAGQIQFVDRFNATIQVTSGYYAYIFDSTGVSACNITRAALANGATLVSSGQVGYNNAGTGWYDYSLMSPTPTPHRVVVITDASSPSGITLADEVFVLELDNIGYQVGSCSIGQFQGLLTFTINEL